MLQLLRQRHARPWMVLAAMVWLVATFASQWHEVVVPHARCPEHGELLQVAPGEQSPDQEIAAAPPESPHDACALHVLAGAALPVIGFQQWEPESVPAERALALISADLAARPLSFAPKTSPPPIA